MNRNEAKQYIKECLKYYLSSNGIDTSKPFRCLNPNHEDKHPSMTYWKKGNKCKCQVCGACYDTFDVIGILEGLTDTKDIFKRAYELFDLKLDQEAPGRSEPQAPPKEAIAAETIIDFTEYYEAAHQAINKTDYHRGLSEETLDRFLVGYDPTWRHPKVPTAPPTPRLIIPITKYCYIARDTRKEIPGEQQSFKKQKVKGAESVNWIYNRGALTTSDKPVFIVEGEIDALSIIDVGGEAVALGSIANVAQFLETVKQNRPKQPLILSLDNEDKPQVIKANEQLEKGLTTQHIIFYRHNIAGKYKDANERLINDREGLAQEVKKCGSIEPPGTLPPFVTWYEVAEQLPTLPPTVIEGILHQGHKLCITAASKAGKSFLLIELCVAIAEGRKWLDQYQCERGKVLYINLEIDPSFFLDRISRVVNALGWDMRHQENIVIWNLCGKVPTPDIFTEELITRIKDQGFSTVIIDPIYKIIDGDENNSEEIKAFSQRIDHIREAAKCSIIYAHHHAKGSQVNKDIIDRASGSGVFARDVDALLDFTRPQLEEGFQDRMILEMNGVLRHYPPINRQYIVFEYPLHRINQAAQNYISSGKKKPKNKDTSTDDFQKGGMSLPFVKKQEQHKIIF